MSVDKARELAESLTKGMPDELAGALVWKGYRSVDRFPCLNGPRLSSHEHGVFHAWLDLPEVWDELRAQCIRKYGTEAEDLVHEVLLTALRIHDRYEAPKAKSGGLGWLAGILAFKARRWKPPTGAEPVEEAHEPVRDSRLSALYRCFRELEAELQEIVQRWALDETYDAIASTYGWSRDQARGRVRKALKLLQECLQRLGIRSEQ